MNKFGWFCCGGYFVWIIFDVLFLYLGLGTPNQRIAIFIVALLGIGFSAIFMKDKKDTLVKNGGAHG